MRIEGLGGPSQQQLTALRAELASDFEALNTIVIDQLNKFSPALVSSLDKFTRTHDEFLQRIGTNVDIIDIRALCNTVQSMAAESAASFIAADEKLDLLGVAIFGSPRSGSNLHIKLDQLAYILQKHVLPKLKAMNEKPG